MQGSTDTEVVVSVHGTFAAKSEDAGPEWWQHGSDFWQRLAAQLPAHITQIARESTFHWSGINAASERRAAARRLLKLLEQLEKAGQTYHLIGHSHGGSVIWDTLLLASRRRAARRRARKTGDALCLPGLLSWTTVGTPYIRSRASLSRLVVAFFSGVLMLFSVIMLVFGIFQFPSLVDEMGHTRTWIMIGMFVAVFYASLGSTIAGLEAQRADTENQVAGRVLSFAGDRWLGLWHRADEAINGLRLSVALSGEIIPRRHRLYHAFAFPALSMLFAPLALILNPIFNWVLAPAGDRFVWKRVKNSATGNDRPGTYAREIEKSPLLHSDALPSLPPRIETALTEAADRATQASAPRLRQLLGRLSSGLGKGLAMEVQQSGLSGRELIHTSYFHDPDVTQLIALHLAERSQQPTEFAVSADLHTWLQEFKVGVAELVAAQPRSFAVIWKALLVFAALILAIYAVSYIFQHLSPLLSGAQA